MTATVIPKNQRVTLRLNNEAKRTIERAASFEGKTVSKFILTSALASAEQAIHVHETMALNKRDSERFLTRCQNLPNLMLNCFPLLKSTVSALSLP